MKERTCPSDTDGERDSPEPCTVRDPHICASPQDDATVKCWGSNYEGQLGLGDWDNWGDDANGACPASSTNVFLVPAPLVLTLAHVLRVQRWGRTSLQSTWGMGGRP